MGVGGAAGRLIELRERERRAQFEAARSLLLARPRSLSGRRLPQSRGWLGRVLSRISPRARCSSASNAREPVRSTADNASSSMATARSASPARASASASAIFNSPSKYRTFCSRSSSTPRRMSASPSAGAPLAAVAQPSRNTPNAPCMGRSCSRARRTSSNTFGATRACSPRINSNKAACIRPTASVPTWVRPAIRVCIRSMSEIARSTSPRGHDATARLNIALAPASCPNRKARSSSRPGWNKASALSK